MATIEQGRTLMTLVNVFTVKPDKQAELAELLVRATDETMKDLPGFMSASIHRSLDGTKVINYAQWRSQADFAALKDNPKAQPHMKAAAALASFEPIVCEVVDSVALLNIRQSTESPQSAGDVGVFPRLAEQLLRRRRRRGPSSRASVCQSPKSERPFFGIAREIIAKHLLGLVEPPGAEQRGAERFARRVEPVGRLVVAERVLGRHRALPRRRSPRLRRPASRGRSSRRARRR